MMIYYNMILRFMDWTNDCVPEIYADEVNLQCFESIELQLGSNKLLIRFTVLISTSYSNIALWLSLEACNNSHGQFVTHELVTPP